MRTSAAAILCLESSQSRFAASQQVYGSSSYDLVTVTNTASALAALRSIPAIRAAVLPCDESVPERQFQLAADWRLPGLEYPR